MRTYAHTPARTHGHAHTCTHAHVICRCSGKIGLGPPSLCMTGIAALACGINQHIPIQSNPCPPSPRLTSVSLSTLKQCCSPNDPTLGSRPFVLKGFITCPNYSTLLSPAPPHVQTMAKKGIFAQTTPRNVRTSEEREHIGWLWGRLCGNRGGPYESSTKSVVKCKLPPQSPAGHAKQHQSL